MDAPAVSPHECASFQPQAPSGPLFSHSWLLQPEQEQHHNLRRRTKFKSLNTSTTLSTLRFSSSNRSASLRCASSISRCLASSRSRFAASFASLASSFCRFCSFLYRASRGSRPFARSTCDHSATNSSLACNVPAPQQVETSAQASRCGGVLLAFVCGWHWRSVFPSNDAHHETLLRRLCAP